MANVMQRVMPLSATAGRPIEAAERRSSETVDRWPRVTDDCKLCARSRVKKRLKIQLNSTTMRNMKMDKDEREPHP